MLSIEACRKHLQKSKSEMTDEQIEEIKELLYQLAEVMVKNYQAEKIMLHQINRKLKCQKP